MPGVYFDAGQTRAGTSYCTRVSTDEIRLEPVALGWATHDGVVLEGSIKPDAADFLDTGAQIAVALVAYGQVRDGVETSSLFKQLLPLDAPDADGRCALDVAILAERYNLAVQMVDIGYAHLLPRSCLVRPG